MADVIIWLIGLSEIGREGDGPGCHGGQIWIGPAEHRSAVEARVKSDPKLQATFREGAEFMVWPESRVTRAELRRMRDVIRRRLTEINPSQQMRDEVPLVDEALQRATEAAEDVWSLVDNERAAAAPSTTPTPVMSEPESAEARVAQFIAQHIKADKSVNSLTRDGIAREIGISAGAVSNTDAWKKVSSAKRSARAPANIEEAIQREAEKQNWDRVRQLQKQEERPQARLRRTSESG